ncbi:hypothetical protein [Streptomyces profundus]|uniref:hypothetical protein n=1 Tax=Streptomyces profundus TaxID=2867410 RepID=UPI001D168012|nr:hypothetical protein [Streptomyces sp. MA3_2.13]UED84780.1 hypothetical protein K4G22_11655 [Streptomyces sp. MA3_2.13]
MTQHSRAARTLRLASVTATATGALLAVGAGAAAANVLPETLGNTLGTTTDVTQQSLGSALDPALDLQLYPLANTGTDPLDNTVGTQVADFKPVGTDLVTGPISEGASARTLLGGVPLLGELFAR